MFERFTKTSRAVVEAAFLEARAAGSPTIEAEHMLLALTRDAAVADLLGLDHDALADALDVEFAAALDVVGVSAATYGLPPASPSPKQAMGTSGRLALERAVKLAAMRRDKRLEPAHLVLGVLRADHGTVPRALALAGVDRTAVADRLAATL
jgi:D-alanyl-D-alanine carboxypeptidase